MKTLNLVVNLEGLEMAEEDKTKTPQELSVRIIENVILMYAQQHRGLDARERTQFYSIKATLNAAVADKLNLVELEDTDGGFMRMCFRETKLMPNDLLKQVETNVSEMSHHK